MSWNPTSDPTAAPCNKTPDVQTIIAARPKDIGALTVGRVLPSIRHKSVGPFVFFDHIGPAVLPPGAGITVRPHPHINLATLTYLFDGEIEHRDSLGVHQVIRPGEVNWMIAGSGIVHSERSSAQQTEHEVAVHGIQVWVGLPKANEEMAPQFAHHSEQDVPLVERPGVRLRIVAGTAYGQTSPVHTLSPLFYVDATLDAGSELELPAQYSERAAFVVQGEVCCGPQLGAVNEMLVLSSAPHVRLRATVPSRLILVGGDALDGPRSLWWNFVSSDPARLERAKADWKAGRFPKVPGDENDFIPLPEQ